MATANVKDDIEDIDLEDGLHEIGPSLAGSLQVNVDGPFGAPAQDHSSYSLPLIGGKRQNHATTTSCSMVPAPQ